MYNSSLINVFMFLSGSLSKSFISAFGRTQLQFCVCFTQSVIFNKDGELTQECQRPLSSMKICSHFHHEGYLLQNSFICQLNIYFLTVKKNCGNMKLINILHFKFIVKVKYFVQVKSQIRPHLVFVERTFIEHYRTKKGPFLKLCFLPEFRMGVN